MNLSAEHIIRTDYDRLEEQVDPRVQVELERLNTATDDINRLEVELGEARSEFRQKLLESSLHLESIAKKLSSSIEKARPYYEARIRAKEALLETQKAAMRFEKANSSHAAAKEMVFLAEEGLTTEGRTFDHAWQEMLNHATMRVNESELERTLSEGEHKKASLVYHSAELKVELLQRELKRSISKSRPYFELKAQYNKGLEEEKSRIKELERKVSTAKASYSEALRNLEHISDQIHRSRKCREVGSDAVSLSPDGTVVSSSSNTDSSPSHEETTAGGDGYLRLPYASQASHSPAESNYVSDYKKLEETVSPCERSPGGEEEWSEISLSPEPRGGGGDEAGSGGSWPAEDTTPNTSHGQPQPRSHGRPQLNRRQSLDVIISGSIATGERVKEILEKGIMKLNMSSLSLERRGSEPRLGRTPASPLPTSARLSPRLSLYDHDSDTDSHTSGEMLTDEQIGSLMLDQELQEAYQDIFVQLPRPK